MSAVQRLSGGNPTLLFRTFCRNSRSAPGRIRTSDSRFRKPLRSSTQTYSDLFGPILVRKVALLRVIRRSLM
jgi:hypothetical protein